MTNSFQHFGLIPDGTRRWSKNNKKKLIDSYRIAMEKISEFVNHLFQEHEISTMSIYLLSIENLNRKPCDLLPVLEAEIQLFETFLPSLQEKLGLQIIHVGNSKFLPKNYLDALIKLCKASIITSKKKLYLLAAYNPFYEINTAIRNPGHSQVEIENLQVTEPLDLVLRSSGESRLSNFLPIQSGYAEIIIAQKHFNDLTVNDLEIYIGEFYNRSRRFGK